MWASVDNVSKINHQNFSKFFNWSSTICLFLILNFKFVVIKL